MEQILNERFQKECGQEVDHELVHILVQMKFQGYCELPGETAPGKTPWKFPRACRYSQCLLALRQNQTESIKTIVFS